MHFAYLFKLPEEVENVTRERHHSKFELIRTDDTGKEFLENIIKQVYVLR